MQKSISFLTEWYIAVYLHTSFGSYERTYIGGKVTLARKPILTIINETLNTCGGNIIPVLVCLHKESCID